MPQKTYYKPNRTKIRHFKTCDAARVAREVLRFDSETTPEEVLACIAMGLGFTHISLSRVQVVEASLVPAVIRNFPALIEKFIVILANLIKKYSWLKPYLKEAIEDLMIAKKLVDKFIEMTEPKQELCINVINREKCACKKEVPNRPLIEKT